MVALLEACDATNKGRHLGRHLGCYQELEIRLKPRQMAIFCPLQLIKITHEYALRIISSAKFTFIIEGS